MTDTKISYRLHHRLLDISLCRNRGCENRYFSKSKRNTSAWREVTAVTGKQRHKTWRRPVRIIIIITVIMPRQYYRALATWFSSQLFEHCCHDCDHTINSSATVNQAHLPFSVNTLFLFRRLACYRESRFKEAACVLHYGNQAAIHHSPRCLDVQLFFTKQ
jgi:hypothetical protein